MANGAGQKLRASKSFPSPGDLPAMGPSQRKGILASRSTSQVAFNSPDLRSRSRSAGRVNDGEQGVGLTGQGVAAEEWLHTRPKLRQPPQKSRNLNDEQQSGEASLDSEYAESAAHQDAASREQARTQMDAISQPAEEVELESVDGHDQQELVGSVNGPGSGDGGVEGIRAADDDQTKAFERIDSQPDELDSPNQDLALNVAELCEQGRGEAALELVRTDLRNISQPLCTDIMLAFAEAGRSDCAQAALLHMQTLCVETGAQLDANTFNALMLAYARDAATATDDGLDQAFGVLELMLRAQMDPDITTYNRLMEACSAAADAVDPFSKGLQVLDSMKEGKRVVPNIETFNTMLEACGKRGWSTSTGDGLRIGDKVLEKMAEEEVAPTVDTFNILMYGCAWAAGAGDGWLGVERGLNLLQQMAEMEIMPDVISFNNLIAACAQAAGASDGPLARDQALKLLRMMQAVGLEPDQGTCDTLIATCAKTAAAGDKYGVIYGVKVLALVHQWELSPDPSMYNALLARCLQLAQTQGPGYPSGWNGVRWMANLLGILRVCMYVCILYIYIDIYTFCDGFDCC